MLYRPWSLAPAGGFHQTSAGAFFSQKFHRENRSACDYIDRTSITKQSRSVVSSSLLKRTCDSSFMSQRFNILRDNMSETELKDRLIAEESTDKILAEIRFISEVLTAEHLKDFLKR